MSYSARLKRSPATASAIVASSAVAVLAVVLISLVCTIEPGLPPKLVPRLDVVTGPLGSWGIWWESRLVPPSQIQREALVTLTQAAAWLGGGSIAIALLSLLLHAVSRILAEWRALAVRCALGATLRHLLALVGAELVGLGAIGSGLGLLAGVLGVTVLRQAWPAMLTRPGHLVPALGAALAVACLVALLLGGIALALLALLQRGVRTVSDLHGDHVTAPGPLLFVQSALAALQLAGLLTVTYGCFIVMGASLPEDAAGRSGDADHTDVAALTWGGPAADTVPARAAAYRRLTDSLRFPDGTTRAGVSSPDAWLAVGGELAVLTFCYECRIGDTLRAVNTAHPRVIAVAPGDMAHLPMHVRRGRKIVAADTLGGELVAVLSRALAAQLYPGADPISKMIRPNGFLPGPEYRVVGVVDADAPRGLGNSGGRQQVMYVSLLQHPPTLAEVAAPAAGWRRTATQVSASGRAPLPGLGEPRPLAARLATFAGPLRWFGWLFAGLAGTATAIAAYALLAVMVQMVRLRRRDIAIRLAVGAAPRHIVRWVTGKALAITVTGSLIGLSTARWMGDYLHRHFSPSVEADLLMLLEMVVVFSVVGVLASLVPARSASRIHPAVAWSKPD